MKVLQPEWCAYYQATVLKEKHWLLTSLLRSFEHLAFDRTCDVQQGIFEFFVPMPLEQEFITIMKHFEQEGFLWDVKKLPNPLISTRLFCLSTEALT